MARQQAPLEAIAGNSALEKQQMLAGDLWSDMPSQPTVKPEEPQELEISNIFGQAMDYVPINTNTLDRVAKQCAALEFTSAADNETNGAMPDYFLAANGRLVKNPTAVSTNARGTINIEIQSTNPTEPPTEAQVAMVKRMNDVFAATHQPRPARQN